MAKPPWEKDDETEQMKPSAGGGKDDDGKDRVDSRFPVKAEQLVTSDRAALIECIKRGESPTWVCKHRSESTSPRPEIVNLQQEEEIEVDPKVNSNTLCLPQSIPEPIARPPSAFHSGDFREKQAELHIVTQDSRSDVRTGSPFSTWKTPPSSPPRAVHSGHPPTQATVRPRAPSLGSSLSSSYVLRAPTSPLAHATSSPSIELDSDATGQDDSQDSLQFNRRRTLPPGLFSFMHDEPPLNFSRPLPTPTLRREVTDTPLRHQSRRSLTSFTYQPLSSIQMTQAFSRNRRLSFGADASPLQHAAMVGSFEESILRGRMSTAPSKPLQFVAQIGVFGKGNCKPNLKCPAHVSVPFPAVFYNYPSTGRRRSVADDNPSPYVGTIDLDSNLECPQAFRPRKRARCVSKDPEELIEELASPENTAIGRAIAKEARETDINSKLHLGGCYRVPAQGQLQMVIKNPNKTAVKLFIVPYDLEDMVPGTKTFVRQRIFSAGPILEKALTDKPESPLPSDPLKDKHILRYLIHLKFCCPAKGRIYLYDNVRVVFANRVPDGKENLKNEIHTPDPKYSPWKPESHSIGGLAGAGVNADLARRRRSSGFAFSSELKAALEGVSYQPSRDAHSIPPIPPLPQKLHLAKKSPPTVVHDTTHREFEGLGGFLKAEEAAQDKKTVPVSDQLSIGINVQSDSTLSSAAGSNGTDGHAPNGRLARTPEPLFRSQSPFKLEHGNGLLSRQLREYTGPIINEAPDFSGAEDHIEAGNRTS